MHHRVGLLVLFNLHGPKALGAVLGLSVVVPSMRVDLRNSQSQKRKWEELEYILRRGTVGHWGKEGVFLCGSFCVGRRFNGADCSFDFITEEKEKS